MEEHGAGVGILYRRVVAPCVAFHMLWFFSCLSCAAVAKPSSFFSCSCVIIASDSILQCIEHDGIWPETVSIEFDCLRSIECTYFWVEFSACISESICVRV